MSRKKVRNRSHLALCTGAAPNRRRVFAHDKLSVLTSQDHFAKIEDSDKVSMPRQINYQRTF